jgi:hypothetical protein|tara:strand:- start:2016 stop:2132 length:117 start_codon:yes stop_codon:yes gene_type:complete
MNDEIEHEEVKKELGSLMEFTLGLEDELNKFIGELDYQ